MNIPRFKDLCWNITTFVYTPWNQQQKPLNSLPQNGHPFNRVHFGSNPTIVELVGLKKLQPGNFSHRTPPQTCHWMVFSNIFYFDPYSGKLFNFINIFQMGWNHQLVSGVLQIRVSGFHFFSWKLQGETPWTRRGKCSQGAFCPKIFAPEGKLFRFRFPLAVNVLRKSWPFPGVVSGRRDFFSRWIIPCMVFIGWIICMLNLAKYTGPMGYERTNPGSVTDSLRDPLAISSTLQCLGWKPFEAGKPLGGSSHDGS